MSSSGQNTYVFIPGKNWKLSLAELVSFLEARNRRFEVAECHRAFFTLKIDNDLSTSVIRDLGGTIKIGRVATAIATHTVEDAFLRGDRQAQSRIRASLSSSRVADEMVETSSGKHVFGVSVYAAESSFSSVSKLLQRFVGSSLKLDLAALGKKSGFMGFPRRRRKPQLTHVEVLKKNLVERRAEVLFCVGKEQAVVSTTVAVHNPFEFQKRDVGRPVQRTIFAMPPRLARIMVNLASCTPGKSLLDPFCGVGTILQEALLAGAKAWGVDVNPWCVEATLENLRWLKKEYGLQGAEYKVLQGDSRSLSTSVQREVDCVATEPDLGPALRHIPTTAYASKIVDRLRPLFRDFLEGAHDVLKTGGRLLLVTPYIKTRSGTPVTMDVEQWALNVGLRRVHPFGRTVFAGNGARESLNKTASFVDAEKRHRIGREIHVFQK